MWGKSAIGREKEEKKPKYAVNGKILMVPTNDILPNPDQPRREYSYQKLLELSQSIVAASSGDHYLPGREADAGGG